MDISQSNIRQQVLTQIIATMEHAIANVCDPMEAGARAFPGTPFEVLCRAELEVEDRRTEAWWRTIERTIDVGGIEPAITGASREHCPVGYRDDQLDEAFEALLSADGDAA
ncbi:hypothetical protein FV222_02470 [Methylobacterium sp. WL103]|uniref:hypothetical protein n=1 Tax=Methylobacterium sp. WL103 TaxID=2603891 RepID=UPI0011CC7ABD|nr:hypothetical protein [Methylobacterium sp. WL103]TXN07385.1 hypothetical protein FV222_02470 [Methylobacterium sp. WL103]